MEIIENYTVLKFSNLSISMCVGVGYMHMFVVIFDCTCVLPVDTYTCQRAMAGVYYCSLPYFPMTVSPITHCFSSLSGWPVNHSSITISSHLPPPGTEGSYQAIHMGAEDLRTQVLMRCMRNIFTDWVIYQSSLCHWPWILGAFEFNAVINIVRLTRGCLPPFPNFHFI